MVKARRCARSGLKRPFQRRDGQAMFPSPSWLSVPRPDALLACSRLAAQKRPFQHSANSNLLGRSWQRVIGACGF